MANGARSIVSDGAIELGALTLHVFVRLHAAAGNESKVLEALQTVVRAADAV